MSDVPPTLPSFDGIPDPLADGAAPLPALPPIRARRRSRTRAELRRARGIALLVSAGWLFGQLLVLGTRGDLAQVPAGYLVAFGVAPVVAGALCVLSAGSAGRLGVGARASLLAGLALLPPLAFVLGAMVGSPPYAGAGVGNFRDGAFCFHLAVAWTVLPLLLAGFALRGTFVGRSGLRSATLGTAAGLVAAAVITLHCPLSDPFHVGLGHGAAIVASALIGAFVLSRVTRA
jgi:hypothetical protein